MKAEFTAVIETAPEGGYWTICPEIPGANGQGETIDEAKDNLRQAIELMLEDRREMERRLRVPGCYLKREGSSHALWINPKNGVIEAIPGHTEIKEPLAKKILKNLNAE